MATEESINKSAIEHKAEPSPICADPFTLCYAFENTEIRSDELADIARAGMAITAINRLVHNSEIEKDYENSHHLSGFVLGGLFAALDLIGRQLSTMAEGIEGRAYAGLSHE